MLVTPELFGAVGDGVADDTAAILAAIDCAASEPKKPLCFRPVTYRFTQPLAIFGVNVDFGGARLFYDGEPGHFALTLDSNAGAGLDQFNGNEFGNFTLYQSDFAEYDKVYGSASYDPPSIAPGSTISAITPGGHSTTVAVPGARAGGYARATFSGAVAGVEVSARVTADDVVTVTFSNYGNGAADMGPGTINVEVVNNAYHGLCVGGVLGRLRNVKVRGFTGVSLGLGDGIDPVSGVTFSSTAGRAYYWDIDANVSPAAGWGVIEPPRNNENEFGLGFFPINAYNEPTPRRASAINLLVIGGLTTKFRRLALEANCSEETVVLLNSANGCETVGPAYLECNAAFVASPLPRVLAKVASSGNRMRFRHPHGGKFIRDLGTANELLAFPANAVNGNQVLPPAMSRNLVVNGDFTNGSTSWTNWGTNCALSVSGNGVFCGKRARLDLTNGRPNLQQNMHSVSGVFLSGLVGLNITVGAWIRTNIVGVKPRIGGVTGNGGTVGDETDEFITVTYKVPPGATTLELSITTEVGWLTGYVEISNITAHIGLHAAAF